MAELLNPQGWTAAEQRLLAESDHRIRKHRRCDLTVLVRDPAGQPVPEAEVHVQQLRHAFLFGCNLYMLDRFDDVGRNRDYAEQFAALFNYATLPFYWGSYEPQPGQTDEARLRDMAQWCGDQGLAAKGHPLVWHEVVPPWLEAQSAGQEEREVERLLRDRVHAIVGEFAGKIGRWDVINEATVSARFDNPVGRWVRAVGVPEAVSRALHWAREADPQAGLLVNDFNLAPEDYPNLLGALNDEGAPCDAVGLQSHMHKGVPPFTDWAEVCDRYALAGKPLHFTEMTVLSGPLKTDEDWHAHHPDWNTTPEGEVRQAQYVVNLFRVLFGHPAVQAITWWDFSDAGAWQGAPAGLLRTDMSPKLIYGQLRQLLKHEWWTDRTLATDAQGQASLRAFKGDYLVTAQKQGSRAQREGRLDAAGPPWELVLA